MDAGISAVSLIPFADVIKLLRLRKYPKLAKTAIKGVRLGKNGFQMFRPAVRHPVW